MSASPAGLPDLAAAPPSHATTLAVLSAKGGCGASVLAINLAAHCAATARTCLIDLDTCKGDVAGLLDLHSGRSINPMLERIDVIDDVLLQGAVDVHPSGMHVIAQPYDLADLREVHADDVGKLLSCLRQNYQLLVLDLGSQVHATSLSAALLAQMVVVVTTPDLIAVRDTQRLLRLLARLAVAPDRIKLVVNRADAPGGLDVAVIEDQLRTPVVATLPDDPATAQRASAAGRLLREFAPGAPLTAAADALWEHLQGLQPEPHPGFHFHWPWSRR